MSESKSLGEARDPNAVEAACALLEADCAPEVETICRAYLWAEAERQKLAGEAEDRPVTRANEKPVLAREDPTVVPRIVRRVTEHLGYCPHSTPEDERAGLALTDILGRMATVFADALIACGASADDRRKWFGRWNEELDV